MIGKGYSDFCEKYRVYAQNPQWREYWGRVSPSVKFLYGCQSLALPPLGIPGLLNQVGDYYEDPNIGNGTDALLSGCGVFCLGLTGQLASTPGILNDLMDSIKEQYGDDKNVAY